MVREPAVSGTFYPEAESSLKKMLEGFMLKEEQKIKALGVVSPHAGYIYSGRTAGKVFSKIEIPDRVIVIGPNHRGVGEDFAIFGQGTWKTPLGEVAIDYALVEKLQENSSYLKEDELAHKFEHSLEVQVPFLQILNPGVSLVPIAIGSVYTLDSLLEVGKAVGKVVRESKEDILIIASSDMTHFESKEAAFKKDKLAIDAILELDYEKLFKVVKDNKISMCGVLPTVVMLKAVKQFSPAHTELVDYTNSGEVTGDFSEVVAYAGIVIS